MSKYKNIEGTKTTRLVDYEKFGDKIVERYFYGYNETFPIYCKEENCFKISSPFYSSGVHDTLVLDLEDKTPIEMLFTLLECVMLGTELNTFDKTIDSLKSKLGNFKLTKGGIKYG